MLMPRSRYLAHQVDKRKPAKSVCSCAKSCVHCVRGGYVLYFTGTIQRTCLEHNAGVCTPVVAKAIVHRRTPERVDSLSI
jgi:hypothetical protein